MQGETVENAANTINRTTSPMEEASKSLFVNELRIEAPLKKQQQLATSTNARTRLSIQQVQALLEDFGAMPMAELVEKHQIDAKTVEALQRYYEIIREAK